jgi:HPr kinase/phosphorylase
MTTHYNPLDSLEIFRKKSLSVKDFFFHYKKSLECTLAVDVGFEEAEITEPTLHRPGLAMAGYTEVYMHQRVQIIGFSEWSFLNSLTSENRKNIFAILSNYKSPVWIMTHGLTPHPEMVEMCVNFRMPLIVTQKHTLDFSQPVQRLLEEWFSPYSPVHASLVDVYGVGMLYVGPSNIGKSECVLDLVERGHRLVADDLVRLTRTGDTILGRGHHIINHHMEIRGVGIIDIKSLFGIHAVRKMKKVEIVVELQYWDESQDYERTGLVDQTCDIMGIPVQKVVIPVSPGKNITVISEVVAMNTLLKMSGVDSAAEFNQKLIDAIADKKNRRDSEFNFDMRSFSSDIYE